MTRNPRKPELRRTESHTLEQATPLQAHCKVDLSWCQRSDVLVVYARGYDVQDLRQVREGQGHGEIVAHVGSSTPHIVSGAAQTRVTVPADALKPVTSPLGNGRLRWDWTDPGV